MTIQSVATKTWILALLSFGFALLGCKGSGSSDGSSGANPGAAIEATKGQPGSPTTLNGAGATFPYPLYSKWIAEFGKTNSNVRINYQSIGSGGGIRQVLAGTVDFGASDAPMTESEVGMAKRKLAHVPTTLGAVVLAYNLSEVPALNLSGDVVAAIFLGTIKSWNDPKIAALNPEAKLPAKDIVVVFRSDGSGTTDVFTDYLTKVSPEFTEKVGRGKSVKWPAGLGAKGNEGVTGQVKTSPGAIGYVELAYATQNNLSTAAVKNEAGEFVKASVAAVTAAAAGVPMPDSLTVSVTNSAGKGGYPISAYTYILVHEDTQDAVKGKALVDFLWWAVHDGQKLAEALHYAPLPDSVIKQVEVRLKSLKAGEKVLLGG